MIIAWLQGFDSRKNRSCVVQSVMGPKGSTRAKPESIAQIDRWYDYNIIGGMGRLRLRTGLLLCQS